MNFNRNLGNYPGTLITISLSVALFLIGFCGWIALTSKELIKFVKQNIEVQVYLEKGLDSTETGAVRNEILKKGFVEVIDGKPAVSFITKEVAAKAFFEETKENYQDILGENPFRDAYSFKVNDASFGEANLKRVKTEVEKIKGVFEVDYARDFVKGIISNVNKVYTLLAIVVIIFFVATILLINNTIKLALYSQRFIIRTMQLVGATNGFIQKPFIIKGMVQGLIASLVAIVLVFITQKIAVSQIEGLSLIQNNYSMLILGGILIVLGPVIGVSSTFQSIIRYLKMDLDELY